MGPPRRRLEELGTLYGVNPAVRDVLVEGSTDAQFFRWYLKSHGASDVGVYPVDDRVEVPGDLVTAARQDRGARGRLVTVALEASSWELPYPALTCIVDADRHSLGDEVLPPDCLMTDFGGVEAYILQPRPMEKLLGLKLTRQIDPAALIESLLPPLNELYIVRAALHAQSPAQSLVDDFSRCCTVDREPITVDTEELVRRSLRDAYHLRPRVLEEVERLRERLPSDRRVAVRGHDIAPLLIKLLQLKNRHAQPDALEEAIRLALEPADLDEFPLFQALLTRVSANTSNDM